MPGLGGSAHVVWGNTALCKCLVGEIGLPEGGGLWTPRII